MNHGASLAQGAILLFLHADTQLPTGALDRITQALEADPDVVAGAFDLGIDSPRRVFRITERYVALRTRLTRVPFGDQAIFMKRAYFAGINGYREIPIMEDVELMQRVKKSGKRITIIPRQVSTSARRWEQEGILYCTFRNWTLQLLYLLGVSPERLAQWYR
jgi:rSAM/selenodomain-associated transferase 2